MASRPGGILTSARVPDRSGITSPNHPVHVIAQGWSQNRQGRKGDALANNRKHFFHEHRSLQGAYATIGTAPMLGLLMCSAQCQGHFPISDNYTSPFEGRCAAAGLPNFLRRRDLRRLWSSSYVRQRPHRPSTTITIPHHQGHGVAVGFPDISRTNQPAGR